MFSMRVKIMLVIFVTFLCISSFISGVKVARFTSVKCAAYLNSTKDPYCFIKAWIRKFPKLNFGFNLSRKISDGQVSEDQKFYLLKIIFDCFQHHLSVEHKMNGAFNKIVNLRNLPICKILDGSSENIFMLKVIEIFRSRANELMDICSRSGEFKISNFSLANSSFLLLWPPGDYKVGFTFFDKNDESIYNLAYGSTVLR